MATHWVKFSDLGAGNQPCCQGKQKIQQSSTRRNKHGRANSMAMMRDPYMRVEVIESTPNPQQVIYAAMHQDYSDGFVWDERDRFPDETKAGDVVVKQLLNGNRGHYGPLEHPQVTLNCGWFPHSTMQQIRTHRVGITVDCQSFRYTSKKLVEAASDRSKLESVVYVRPVGDYVNRQGKRYIYTQSERDADLDYAFHSLRYYAAKINRGFAEEHARGQLPFDVRQHWVMSLNVRSLMHLLDLRWKADAQIECQWLCNRIFPHFEQWAPAIAGWYKNNRAHKARLAP